LSLFRTNGASFSLNKSVRTPHACVTDSPVQESAVWVLHRRVIPQIVPRVEREDFAVFLDIDCGAIFRSSSVVLLHQPTEFRLSNAKRVSTVTCLCPGADATPDWMRCHSGSNRSANRSEKTACSQMVAAARSSLRSRRGG
jgi:hypothetical protein